MSSVNLKQLAHMLGLSASTVSRALRDSYEISGETKKRVQDLATKVGYQPNPYASSLRNQVVRTIAVVVPEIANHFFSLAINGIEEVARQEDYHVLVYLTHDNYAREVAVAQFLTSGRVDGALMSLASETRDFAHLETLRQKGLPLVFFDRVWAESGSAQVTTDDYASGFGATAHLLAAGCRHIAYLMVSGNLSIGTKRWQGYLDALSAHGVAHEPDLTLDGHGSNEENLGLITQLLHQHPDIDGIFASVERLAISSYQACHGLNRRIPEDIKIIGFSNLEIAALLNPSLTTVTQPAYDIGKEAAQLLFSALKKGSRAPSLRAVELKSELIVRRSTGGPPPNP